MIGYQYTIENSDGESFVINDHTTNPNQIIALQQYPAFDVDIKTNEVDKEGQHGVWDFFSYYGRRNMTFEGVIVGSDEANAETTRKKIVEVLSLPTQPTSTRSGYVTIKWTDANGESWQVEGRVIRSPRFSRVLKQDYRLDFTFTLKSDDPFIISQTENTTNGTRGYIDNGGVVVPVEFPFSWTFTNQNVLTVTNTGAAFAQTIIRLNGEASGAITNPVVKNLTTGSMFQVNTTIADENSWIEIDTKNGTVVNQDGVDLSGLITSDSSFILLSQGANEIMYLSDEDPYNALYLPTATFSVKHRNTTV